MSKVSELVDEEAAKAEAETPDEEEAESTEVEGQDGEPEAPAEPAPSGEPTPDDIKAFQSEHARHEKALVKIMGDDFGMLVVCDECGGMGYRPPAQLRTNEKYRMCEVCNGHARVLTGSKDEQWYTQPCPGCGGRGFQERLPEAPAAPPTQNGETQQQPQYGTPAWMGNPDVSPGAYVAPVGG